MRTNLQIRIPCGWNFADIDRERKTIMIKSKTKYNATNEEIVKIFAANHMPGIKSVEPLGNGEFNAALLGAAAWEL